MGGQSVTPPRLSTEQRDHTPPHRHITHKAFWLLTCADSHDPPFPQTLWLRL